MYLLYIGIKKKQFNLINKIKAINKILYKIYKFKFYIKLINLFVY